MTDAGRRIPALRDYWALAVLLCACSLGVSAAFPPNSLGACPNEDLRVAQGSTFLPECRAYEMVSPLDKGGVDVLGYTQKPFSEARADGNVLAYGSPAAFGDAKGAAFPSIYRAVRSASGWASAPVSPPQNATVLGGLGGGNTSIVGDLSADLTGAIVRTNRSLAPGASENVPNLYRRDLLTDAYDLLTTGGPAEFGLESKPPTFAAATPDLSTVAFNSYDALTPDAPAGSDPKAYVFRNGSLELASVLPGNVPTSGYVGDFQTNNTRTALSADGRVVYFALREGGGDEPKGLYRRDLDAETTTEIVDPSVRAYFLSASSDGSKVLWRTTDPSFNDESLFLYDAPSGDTVRLAEHIPGDEEKRTVSVLDVNDDLSSIYFIQRGTLVAGQPEPPADSPAEDPYGIYRWQPGTGEITFIAYIGGAHETDQLAQESSGQVHDSLETRRDVAATPDGSVLVFATRQKVMPPGESGYENKSPSPACNRNGDERCREVYRYSAADDSVTCVSCPEETPTADAGLPGATAAAAGSTAHQHSFSQAHAVSADGSKVFFESGEQLVMGDTNGRDDVYMWLEGGRQLLSGGTSQHHSRMIDASPTGDDVFFVTRERLVGWDRDELADVYDVRVGGGFPEPPPPPPPGCLAGACQGPAAQPPAALTPASALVKGRGNARPCRRGQKGKRNKARGRAASMKQARAEASGKRGKKRSHARKCRGAK